MRFWRVLIPSLFIAALALLMVVPVATAQSQTDLEVDHFNSDIILQPDGVVSVTEEITVNFFDDLHGIYRYIPTTYAGKNQEYYTEVMIEEIRRGGQPEPYEQSVQNGNLEIKIGDPDTTLSGKQTYTISYTVKGILVSYADYDELYWNVTGNDWEVPINSSRATITLPQPGLVQQACYVGAPGSTTPCQIDQSSESEVEFSTNTTLNSGEGITIAVGYTKGMVPILRAEKPKSDVEILLDQAKRPLILLLGLAALAGGLFIPWWLWYRFGRDWWWKKPEKLQTTSQTASPVPWRHAPQVVVEFEPPLDLRPAQIGMLIDQKADTLDVTSTIIDLASRGYVTITEIDKTWIFGSKDYQLNRTDASGQNLLEFERLLLDSLFKSGQQIKLSDLKNTFYSDLAQVKEAIRNDLMERDYFVKNPQKVRQLYLAVGAVSLVVGIGGAIIGVSLVQIWLIGVSILPTIAGIGLMIVSGAMPQRTAKGREAYRRILGYELFISTAEKYRQQFFENKNIFTQVLPYAMVFGLTDKFATAMEQIGYQPPQPTWYYGLHAFNVATFSQDMGRVSNAFSTTMDSSPSSSGSGGGGFSGGGFGGGGGGGW